jgi:chromate transporter
VSVGCFAAGLPGAIAGWLAMITPALLSIPLVHFVGRRMEHPRVRSVLQTVVIASTGLLLAAAIPLGRDGLTGPVTWRIAPVCFVQLLTTTIDTLSPALADLFERQSLVSGAYSVSSGMFCHIQCLIGAC